jgi:4-hydroxy 2-oxovalerate aldolase
MIKDANDKGYETTCNLMAVSTCADAEIDQALEEIAKTPCSTVVVVDSFGSMYQEQIKSLVERYKKALDGTGKEVGLHAHNNQELAFANTIEAIINGANRIDATMGGMGRGAGNCRMELLLGFLRNPRYHVRPVWQLIQDYVVPLQRTMEWGALPPYVIAGQYNQHPRAAIAWRASEQRDACADFYDRVIADV